MIGNGMAGPPAPGNRPEDRGRRPADEATGWPLRTRTGRAYYLCVRAFFAAALRAR